MKTKFKAEFFRGNRTKLKDLVSSADPIVITANGLMQRNSDSTFQFRQDSNFWYLTGIDEPDTILVIDNAQDYLIVPDQSDYQHAFDGTIEYKELSEISGIKTVLGAKEGWKRLHLRLQTVKQVAVLAVPPAFVEPYGMYTNPARKHLADKLMESNSKLVLTDVRPQLSQLRAIKQPIEVQTLQAAINLTLEAINKATSHLAKMKYEYELEAEIVSHFLQAGAYPAWKPIVAAGSNGTILHYIANRSPLRGKDLIYVDVGAEISHYTADITRTFSIGGDMSSRQKDIVNSVRSVQEYAFSLLKPGVIIKDYEKQIEQFMGEKLRELGLIKIIDHQSVRHYYPHATSHFLGLDAHDVGDYSMPLEPNMVLTVEPGIYIPEEGIGVRIEDDILITDDGYKNLSATVTI